MAAADVIDKILETTGGKVTGASLEAGEGPGEMLLLLTRKSGPAAPAETVACLRYGPHPPAGHASSPWDGGDWVHQIDARGRTLRATALAVLKFAHPDPLYIYVRHDHEDATACQIAGFRLCGIASGGWRVWTSSPPPRDE